MKPHFKGIYAGKKVLVTGHTGFKGSWLALWLHQMGAEVSGLALDPPSDPSHFDRLKLPIRSTIGTITDAHLVKTIIGEVKPDIVFHLAAQPIVRASYADPAGTYATNVLGTMHVCEACRATPSVRAIVAITTDKVYRNHEWCWGYRETDELGGYDPYSSSKACADILLSSYRDSFLNASVYGTKHNVLLAVARAGNVIGGGDWAQDRLIPDIARAVSRSEPLVIRSPESTRPWQHVLDCLSGYLLTGQRLLQGDKALGTALNFGPPAEDVLPVEAVVKAMIRAWPSVKYRIERPANPPHEAGVLTLDCSKARSMLGWNPVWDFETAIDRTASWYREFHTIGSVQSTRDLDTYIADASAKEAVWTR